MGQMHTRRRSTVDHFRLRGRVGSSSFLLPRRDFCCFGEAANAAFTIAFTSCSTLKSNIWLLSDFLIPRRNFFWVSDSVKAGSVTGFSSGSG